MVGNNRGRIKMLKKILFGFVLIILGAGIGLAIVDNNQVSSPKQMSRMKNIAVISNVLAPTITPASGTYADALLTITIDNPNPSPRSPRIEVGPSKLYVAKPSGVPADVYYTTDGTIPTNNSARYAQPFSLNIVGLTIVKAIAINESGSKSPVVTATYTAPWNKIFAGEDSAYGIRRDGTLWAWGDNRYGQLGDGTLIGKDCPIQIGKDNHWSFVSAGLISVFAIKTDGTLWAWGFNNYGELGDGTTINRLTPVQIGSDNNWAYVSCGDGNSFAIKTDGTLWAWGEKGLVAIGYGNQYGALSPVQIGNDHWSFVCTRVQYGGSAIKADGTLWSWSPNTPSGSVATFNPIQIGNDNNWYFIAQGSGHRFAIKTDGSLWAWGRNNLGAIGKANIPNGVLGDGTTTDRANPYNIGNDYSSVSSGWEHAIAIKKDGTLWAWGYNRSGQLGNGTSGIYAYQNSPIQIGSDNSWSFIACNGLEGSFAVKKDGTLWAWGYNAGYPEFSVLGDGTRINRSSPVQIQ